MPSRRLLHKLSMAARRPDLAFRKLRGLSPIEITPEEIAKHVAEPGTIVEAGALDGADTERIARQWPHAVVHAFEPVPEAYEKTRLRTSSLTNVRTYRLALADKPGQHEMYVSSTADGSPWPDSSSLLEPTGHTTNIPGVRFDRKIMVDTVTLDDWARDHDIPMVDLLWLDMQGVELSVLRAAPHILATTSAVVMEVSRQEMYAGTPLYGEVVSWMVDAGFRIAIDRVSFLFGNILFVRR